MLSWSGGKVETILPDAIRSGAARLQIDSILAKRKPQMTNVLAHLWAGQLGKEPWKMIQCLVGCCCWDKSFYIRDPHHAGSVVLYKKYTFFCPLNAAFILHIWDDTVYPPHSVCSSLSGAALQCSSAHAQREGGRATASWSSLKILTALHQSFM